MEVPDGVKNPNRANMICKLQKSLYGLKQAPRQWYAKIHNFLVEELEVTSSSSDSCLYFRRKSSSILIIALYVDDLLIAGSKPVRNRRDQGGASQTV